MRIGCRTRSIFRDEEGFTTTSMVISLLITLALVFTAAQVYRINSASAEVQDVADAAALAAENQVAEFMVIVRFCDAVVLSLSLAGLTVCGVGVVALCIPPTAALGEGLLEAGGKIVEARDRFSERATSVLNKLQEALPYFAAACAAATAAANNGDSSGSRYVAAAILVPAKADAIGIERSNSTDKFLDDTNEKANEIREKAREAEEAAAEANASKQRAFMRDCGDNPDYCMYERAEKLAGLSGANNPLFGSIDTWTFTVALERAKSYYGTRRYNEQPEDDSAEAEGRQHLRKRYYEYAYQLIVREGYVRENGDSFDAHFPRLPRNLAEIKQTELYTERIYPVTGTADEQMMHAWIGCPGATEGVDSYASIADMADGDFETCPLCNFTVASMGSIASASTSISNGFEYHYTAVAEEADNYREARKRADGPKQEVESDVSALFGELLDALKEAAGKRIEASPPGKYGAIAFVVNIATTSTSGGFGQAFVAPVGSLGTRAAISASTLVDEGSEEGRTVINSMLDGLRQNGGVAAGAAGIALDVWSGMLRAYSNGYESFVGGIETGLNSIPLASASGLGTWSAGKLRDASEGVGLQPAKLEALKPVLVNSAHVAKKDNSAFASKLVATKERIIAHPLYSGDLFSSLLSDAERSALAQVNGMGDSIEIASIELLGDGGSTIPVTIPLPQEAKRFGIATLQSIFDQIRTVYAETTGVRSWE